MLGEQHSCEDKAQSVLFIHREGRQLELHFTPLLYRGLTHDLLPAVIGSPPRYIAVGMKPTSLK